MDMIECFNFASSINQSIKFLSTIPRNSFAKIKIKRKENLGRAVNYEWTYLGHGENCKLLSKFNLYLAHGMNKHDRHY